MLKLLFLCLLTLSSFAQDYKPVNVIVPTLFTGATTRYFWIPEHAQIKALRASHSYQKILEQGFDVIHVDRSQKLWTRFENGRISYYFFTNLDAPVEEKFVIQRVKKTVEHIKNGVVKSKKVTYLVEIFKTWKGITSKNKYANGTLKAADEHWGNFESLSGNRVKLITKEFETGVGAISKHAPDANEWPIAVGKMYWGTDYKKSRRIFDKVRFTDSKQWSLKVQVSKKGFEVESPELGLFADK